jgi:uncharacterized protein YtpQ (UPF0354 family)
MQSLVLQSSCGQVSELTCRVLHCAFVPERRHNCHTCLLSTLHGASNSLYYNFYLSSSLTLSEEAMLEDSKNNTNKYLGFVRTGTREIW